MPAMTSNIEFVFEGFKSLIVNMQAEIALFAVAMCFHAIVFGKYRISSGTTKQGADSVPTIHPWKKSPPSPRANGNETSTSPRKNGKDTSTLAASVREACSGVDGRRNFAPTSASQPSVAHFNERIDSDIRTKSGNVWSLIDEMQACGFKPNRITCSIVLKGIQPGANIDIERAMSLVNMMGESIDEVMLGSVVEACMRVGRSDLLGPILRRQQYSDRVNVKGAHTFGSIIRAYGSLHDLHGVWETWRQMRTRHINPTSITLGCMVEALVINDDVEAGHELITDMLADEQTRPVVNAVIYCSVLKGFSHQRRFDRAWAIYQEMLQQRLTFSIVTFNTLVDACARSREMVRIPDILEDMARQGVEPNVITYSAVIKGYCQDNQLDKAMELLDSMRKTSRLQPDEITYNTLLDGCARQCLCDRGLTLFEEMQANGIRPSNFTLSVLVKMVSRSKRLDKTFEICDDVSARYKFRLNVHVYANLVQACISNRDLSRAFKVLERMANERVRPDLRTYTLLLRACINSGATDEAAGLIRAAAGLQGGHSSLAGFGRAAAQPQGGLPMTLVSELLHGMCRLSQGKCLAMQILKEMKQVPGIKVDMQLQLQLANTRPVDAKDT